MSDESFVLGLAIFFAFGTPVGFQDFAARKMANHGNDSYGQRRGKQVERTKLHILWTLQCCGDRGGRFDHVCSHGRHRRASDCDGFYFVHGPHRLSPGLKARGTDS